MESLMMLEITVTCSLSILLSVLTKQIRVALVGDLAPERRSYEKPGG